MSQRLARVIGGAILLTVGAAAGAQEPAAKAPAPFIPQVVTVGRGEVTLKPDRAQLEFGVETRASTAAAAAAENSRRQRAVLDTLQRLGIANDKIQTAQLQINPEMVYPGQGQAPRVAGYTARNTVRVEVQKLEQVGTLVDAALQKGATNIMGLQFYASRSAEARREALALAVGNAKLDAEAMAKAAGYQLGQVLEITGEGAPVQPIAMNMDMARGMKLAAAAEPTPINPGELKVVETATVRWVLRPQP
ncbi:MAG: SIMPL domain-containing protein [Gemmatimonadaceae bacterium]|nr:SIMPL domain-containing protein [Gemmatimonadaceae bacterium]